MLIKPITVRESFLHFSVNWRCGVYHAHREWTHKCTTQVRKIQWFISNLIKHKQQCPGKGKSGNTGNGQNPRENRNSGTQDTGKTDRKLNTWKQTILHWGKGKTELKYT